MLRYQINHNSTTVVSTWTDASHRVVIACDIVCFAVHTFPTNGVPVCHIYPYNDRALPKPSTITIPDACLTCLFAHGSRAYHISPNVVGFCKLAFSSFQKEKKTWTAGIEPTPWWVNVVVCIHYHTIDQVPSTRVEIPHAELAATILG